MLRCNPKFRLCSCEKITASLPLPKAQNSPKFRIFAILRWRPVRQWGFVLTEEGEKILSETPLNFGPLSGLEVSTLRITRIHN